MCLSFIIQVPFVNGPENILADLKKTSSSLTNRKKSRQRPLSRQAVEPEEQAGALPKITLPMQSRRDFPLLGTNISLSKAVLKMSFLFPRLDMLICWRVSVILMLLVFVSPGPNLEVLMFGVVFLIF